MNLLGGWGGVKNNIALAYLNAIMINFKIFGVSYALHPGTVLFVFIFKRWRAPTLTMFGKMFRPSWNVVEKSWNFRQ